MLKKASHNNDAAKDSRGRAKTYRCPVQGCPHEAEYVGFAAHEVILRQGQTLEALLGTATHTNNAKAPEARNLLVKCPIHGQKILQLFGHHITGSKKQKRPRDVPDVSADDPAHTMDRFREGLRRVLATPKPTQSPRQPTTKRRRSAR